MNAVIVKISSIDLIAVLDLGLTAEHRIDYLWCKLHKSTGKTGIGDTRDRRTEIDIGLFPIALAGRC